MGWAGRDGGAPVRDSAPRVEARRRQRDPQHVLPNLGRWREAEKTRAEKLRWLWVIFVVYLLVRMGFAAGNWFYRT